MNKPKQVIAYYPGAGGNRFLRCKQGLEFTTPGRVYDNDVVGQLAGNRYLLPGQEETVSVDTVLTHCMNYHHIANTLGPVRMTLIVSDIQKSLRREWAINGHTNYMRSVEEVSKTDEFADQFPKVQSAWAAIQWHMRYYAKYPVDLLSSGIRLTTVKIDQNNDPFSISMRAELDSYQSKEFDFAWNLYKMRGEEMSGTYELLATYESEHGRE